MALKVILGHNFYRSSAPSGEDTVYRNERDLLVSNGLDIISYEKFNDDLDDSSLAKKFDIAMNGAWSRQSYDEISALIKSSRPDLVHFHSIFPQISPSAYFACRDNNVPVVHTLHNYRPICPGAMLIREGKPCEDCLGTNLLPAIQHRCYRGSLLATGAIAWQITRSRFNGAYGMVNRFIALTSFAASRYENAGFPKHQLAIKPNFLSNPPIVETEIVEPYAVFVGRLSEEKGIFTLLKAWRDVQGLPLKILGDGPLNSQLRSYASKENLNVEFLGFLANDKSLQVVANAKLQIIPSEWYEGFPMVVLEAYAMGVPLVVSRIGSLEEVVLEGKTGVKFNPGDITDLAIKVNSLKDNAPLLVTMKNNAKALFRQRYTAAENFKQLMAIYKQVISEHNGE